VSSQTLPDEASERELAEALAAARAGDGVRAQELAWQSLRHNPRREAAWLLLTSLVPSREDQEMCLRQVLSINPQHAFARDWFEKVAQSENPQALRLPVIDETAVRPPAAPRPVGRVLGLDTVPVTLRPVALRPATLQPEAKERRADPVAPRILVVDDSSTVRRLVALALGRFGCDVITASGGMEALGVLSHATPDLVLLDVGLPNLDGHQICRAIKRNERTRQVPVVMLTGRDGLMDRLRGKMAGADEYLTKPFDPKLLIEVVKKYLPLRESKP
jgi:twitching motility two-component system response regulator PilG